MTDSVCPALLHSIPVDVVSLHGDKGKDTTTTVSTTVGDFPMLPPPC